MSEKNPNIPGEAERLAHTRLAEGEVTGHFHEAVGPWAGLYAHQDQVYLDAPHGVVLRHQEHDTVAVPAGAYERKIVREFDHLAEEARDVAD